MNRDQFLERDAANAVSEYRASWTNISRVEESLMKGDLKEAKLAAANLMMSLNELSKLQERKKETDQMVARLDFLLKRKQVRMVVVVHED
ncbi:hypothetical protein LC048_21115 [Mesobacillus subterraneus]|uniref:hypothetical protein n=1 Tax=Mesobacillus subterraneus TaxID=285983 RepID=UPI001CFE201E|nr:hypothetical protein [Mesobacillus subterraneus]WLR54866.1 hypothetical protein LC048_21115 [Mesobacillus subterraneus]